MAQYIRQRHGGLLKCFHFTARLGAAILSFNKGKLLLRFISILYEGFYIIFTLEVLIVCLLHMDCTICFLRTVSLFFKTSFT